MLQYAITDNKTKTGISVLKLINTGIPVSIQVCFLENNSLSTKIKKKPILKKFIRL